MHNKQYKLYLDMVNLNEISRSRVDTNQGQDQDQWFEFYTVRILGNYLSTCCWTNKSSKQIEH